MARRWAKHTPKGKTLPARVGKMVAVEPKGALPKAPVELPLMGRARKDRIPGGLADKKTARDFDRQALAAGIAVEMEHTSDRAVAAEIAMDHLTEDPSYYTKLSQMEGKLTNDPNNPADVLAVRHPKRHPEIATRLGHMQKAKGEPRIGHKYIRREQIGPSRYRYYYSHPTHGEIAVDAKHGEAKAGHFPTWPATGVDVHFEHPTLGHQTWSASYKQGGKSAKLSSWTQRAAYDPSFGEATKGHAQVAREVVAETGRRVTEDFEQQQRAKAQAEKASSRKVVKSSHPKMEEVTECPACSGPMLGKCGSDGTCGCGCGDKLKKRRLPLIGAADENLEALPNDLRALISQLPLEMQTTELGGAGQVDPRPSLQAMNYHVPSRYDGSCATCAHSKRNGYVLDCTAINGSPPVAWNGRCDLWTGSAILMRSRVMADGKVLVKSDKGAGPTKPYGTQQMPDYQYIYHVLPDEEEQARQGEEMQHRRRMANAVGHHGFHGSPPEPTLRGDDVAPVKVPPRRAESLTKPTHLPPLVFKRREEELVETRDRLMGKVPNDSLYQEAMKAAQEDRKRRKSKALVKNPPTGV